MSSISKKLKGGLALIWLAAAGLLSADAGAHELEKEMKKMARAFKQAREADADENLLDALGKMRRHADRITEEMEPHDADDGDREDFREGMEKIQETIEAAMTAAKAGDDEALRDAFEAMRDIREEYHFRFDVDDD